MSDGFDNGSRGAKSNGHAQNGASLVQRSGAQNGAARGAHGAATLDIRRLLSGRRLVVIGGTGFLGKVWWAFLLSRYPDVERLVLVVRPKDEQNAEERFWEEISKSPVLDPLRDQLGPAFEAFLRDKVQPVAGNVVHPLCGLDAALRDELRGQVDAVVNVAGVVDFDPPLDEALEVNAFGVQNLVALARDLGDVPLLHTSTCYVAGNRTGFIEEVDPREFPFPRAEELERSHWDPDREIAECLDVIEQARQRAKDAFRQSRFLDEAKRRLKERGEPTRGAVLEAEVARVKRKFVEAQLAQMGMERAKFWGFPNTYTYTKGIGEQIVAASGLPFTIVRPAVVESTESFPFPGWNEGINTSAPLIFIVRQGGLQIPGSDNILDVIPCDMVGGVLTVALAELLEGTAPAVYQVGSSDSNPCTMRRFFELTGLYKRRYYQETGRGGPLVNFIQSHFEGAMLSGEQFQKIGPFAISDGARRASKLLGKAAVGPAASLFKPAAKLLGDFAEQQNKVGKILEVFVPFTAEFNYIFRCDHTRAAVARLSEEDRRLINFYPEAIDWRRWFMDVHVPALEKWVFPKIEERIKKPLKAPARYETLPALLLEMAERHDLSVALQRTEKDGLSRISFREWKERSLACAARLAAAGVGPGDRVLLCGANHPSWPIALFGIYFAGGTAVPLDANVEADVVQRLRKASGAKVLLLDEAARRRCEAELSGEIPLLDLNEAAAPGDGFEPCVVQSSDLAALIYTSGTTGSPKGVMLSHENLTALVASLAPLFPLSKGDRVLSVLPLHHTFELTCGLLLPLSRGARVIYLDELNAERLEHGLKAGRVTALVGVPALWEMLERRITNRVKERGAVVSQAFELMAELNRALGKNLGVDAGRVLFGPVHHGLGGHLKFLVSGGAALPESTHKLFAGMGLHLSEGYGLTEAAPVLTVARAAPGAKPGHVGKPIPGVEIRIADPNPEGVGEVLARGPNVMLGYSDDPEATKSVIDDDGWLHTGDLGKLGRKGELVIVGRAKDTIVSATGENVYPDDVEARLGSVAYVEELSVIGVSDGRGGERVACVAVPEEDDALSRDDRHKKARAALDKALATLPATMRPAVVTLVDAPLPRTSTKKVKRKELRELVERLVATAKDTQRESGSHAASRSVRGAIAAIARRDPDSLSSAMTLRGDLGFDSLMSLELLVALEAKAETTVDAERLSEAQTVADVEQLFREAARPRSQTAAIEQVEEESIELPPLLREAAMEWMGRAQMGFYDKVLHTKVTGRAYIPHNRNTLLAANHASHLDMGLVKYALGSYGRDMVSLAAQDYFFEGNRFRKAYFENLTNLVPMARNGSLRQALRQAGALLDQGKTVLIFPEGTRSPDGEIQEFKPVIGHLSLHHDVDILPIWLGGTHRALPKGAKMLRRRDVHVRIGPPLAASDLKRLTAHLTAADASRAVAKLTRRAVQALSRGRVLDIAGFSPEDLAEAQPLVESLEPVFRELADRFLKGSVESPVSFYFSLGGSERWTIRITRDSCEVAPGKVVDPADCVLKTSPEIFRRIVREAYTPTPAEFMSGMVKSNNIGLLFTFQKAFQLQGPNG